MVRGQAVEWGPGPSAPEIPVPPAAAAECFPDPPASYAAERAPSDAVPPAPHTGKARKCYDSLTNIAALMHPSTVLFLTRTHKHTHNTGLVMLCIVLPQK